MLTGAYQGQCNNTTRMRVPPPDGKNHKGNEGGRICDAAARTTRSDSPLWSNFECQQVWRVHSISSYDIVSFCSNMELRSNEQRIIHTLNSCLDEICWITNTLVVVVVVVDDDDDKGNR